MLIWSIKDGRHHKFLWKVFEMLRRFKRNSNGILQIWTFDDQGKSLDQMKEEIEEFISECLRDTNVRVDGINNRKQQLLYICEAAEIDVKDFLKNDDFAVIRVWQCVVDCINGEQGIALEDRDIPDSEELKMENGRAFDWEG